MTETQTLIAVSTAVVGTTGVVCAAVLAVAAKVFHVHIDERIENAIELLPSANCGGCGYAGCADYAKALVVDSCAINLCAPGGNDVIAALGALMGVSAEAAEKQVALVLCRGDNTLAKKKFEYNGIADCRSAASVGGGDKACSYGCLGYGSCSRVCPSGAIEITKAGLAVVHPDVCISCGACVKACPRSIIRMVPESRNIHVVCSSKDKGKAVKQACKVGCIGCSMCVKLADNESISMDGAIAIVDYSRDLTDKKVIQKCPGKCIVELDAKGQVVEQPKVEKPKKKAKPAEDKPAAEAPKAEDAKPAEGAEQK